LLPGFANSSPWPLWKLGSLLPHFITEIDGLDIHFIHVRSQHEDALPLIVTHGWPGSIIEHLRIIDPPNNPTARGASASGAFHLMIPSLPGYGFSGKPTTTRWDPARIARARVVLMKRLGYAQLTRNSTGCVSSCDVASTPCA
jgi:pimeloyl-ACP methyl ester carboxylesterase